jgi:hypothetical protein
LLLNRTTQAGENTMLDKDALIVTGCMGSIGLFGLIAGILAHLGIYKSLYAMKSYPAFAPNALAYILIPGSVLCFMFALIPFLPSVEIRRNFLAYVIFPYQVFLIVLATWRPEWLKPKWLRWLEREHGDIIELLWKDVREDRWNWESRVRTQAELEAWVAEVRKRHRAKYGWKF